MNLSKFFLIFFATLSINCYSQFVNVATTNGTDIGSNKDGGVTWADINNDGCLDLIINTTLNNTSGRTRMLISDCNSPNPTFSDITQTHINGFRLNQCERSISAGDFNNDGYIDLCRNTHSRFEVYLNKGPTATPAYSFGDASQNPNFTITTIPNGMNVEGFGWMDYNNDGWLDIIIENHGYGIDIYENPADGSSNFFHVTPNGATKGLPTGGSVGDYMTLCDFDDDGDIDILARKSNSERDLWTNQGNGTFLANLNFPIQNVSNGNKGGVIMCDFDNDGDFDIFWTSYGTNQIFEQTGFNSGIFSAINEPALSSGITPNSSVDGCSCGDVDNDGDLDIFLGAGSGSSYLYLNNGNMNFTRNNLGINVSGNTEGNSFGDYDNDGDLDLYINVNGANQLWRNGTNNNDYLKVLIKKDLGGGILRDDLGATAVLKDCDGNILGGIRQVSSVKGHGSNNPAIIHFGLPAGNIADYLLEVRYTTVNGTRLIMDSAFAPITILNQTITMISPDPSASVFHGCSILVLPVELANFKATKNQNKVHLSWTTLSEKDNDYFLIQKSINNIEWETIDRIIGSGNSFRKLNYKSIDYNPMVGINYYRIKQIDFNGKQTYSNTKQVNFDINNNTINIFPNPATQEIHINANQFELKNINIYNLLGQNVTELIKFNSNSTTANISLLPDGIYVIKTTTQTVKFYKN